jgi:hypothetical protein
MPLTVTFDTNALNDVVFPETSQRGASGTANGTKVRAAVQAGVIQGFFSETLVTLEGIQRKDRAEVVGSTGLESSTACTGENTIQMSFNVVQDRKPLDSQFSEMVQGAKSLGLRALRAPARLGWVRTRDEDGTFFAPDGPMIEHLGRMDKVNDMATAIAVRGLGYAKAVELGRKFADCDNASNPEFWFKGLLGASRRQVKLALNEWADGDSVAAHYGYGIDLFCSEDFGKNTSGTSVLDNNNQKWLNEEFGIQFVTLAKLADMVTA